MFKRKQQEEEKSLPQNNDQPQLLKRQSIKELIAPSGIDASNIFRNNFKCKKLCKKFLCIYIAKNVYISRAI